MFTIEVPFEKPVLDLPRNGSSGGCVLGTFGGAALLLRINHDQNQRTHQETVRAELHLQRKSKKGDAQRTAVSI